MKKLYVLSLAAVMCTTIFAQRSLQMPQQESKNKYGTVVKKTTVKPYRVNGVQRSEDEVWNLLACKEGSVYGNELTEDTPWSGFVVADAGRPDMPCEYYMYFDDCFQKFNKVRFLGFFCYWDYDESDWLYCSSRGDMNDKQEMQKPIMFTIGVYEEGEDGMPGKCVYKKDVELYGEKTGLVEGDAVSGYTNIYEFVYELGENIDLEHGFLQINAKDMGDQPSCWFALKTADNPGKIAYLYDTVNEEYMGSYNGTYCLYGDGSYNAQKALQIERILTPSTSANGKYEPLQIEILNIGETTINDAKFEIYVDDKLVATEEVNATIGAFDYYKHTFNTRIDCTQECRITVKNVTPGDEKKSHESISIDVVPPTVGEYPKCEVGVPNIINITNVKFGEINNESEGSSYSDYTAQKVVLKPGDKKELEITVKTKEDWEPKFAAFIDWNGDHSFGYDELVDFETYTVDDFGGYAKATVSVPSAAKVGEQRMRIIATAYYAAIDPSEEFISRGEVEDYTVVVEPAAGDPVVEIQQDFIDKTVDANGATSELTIANNGTGNLEASIDFDYVLPGVPSINNEIAATSKKAFRAKLKATGKAAEQRAAAPEKDPSTQYVLKYSDEMHTTIGLGNASEAIFASMYPGAMLSNIAGMTVSSVDVYVGDVPKGGTSIVIYDQNTQNLCGSVITEQEFTPVAHSWNRITLSNPVQIGDKDMWVGVKMKQLGSKDYCIGVDRGPAKIGFGDIVNIGGDMWWSMADLGMNYNYCIRANVSGNRTPAISWLSTINDKIVVAPGETGKAVINLAPQNLAYGIYEGVIEVSTNDPFAQLTKIPVYMTNADPTSIKLTENDKAGIVINGNNIIVKAAKEIANLKVSDLRGRDMMGAAANGNEAKVDLSAMGKGVYIITVNYADGTSMSFKVPVVK